MNKEKKFNYIALCLCAVGCITWSYVLDIKYERLDYYSWDLPLYANLMWNLCHGSASTTLFGGNFLLDHFNLIAFLIVPFYFFCQSALTLLYFKLFAFFAGSYIFYLLAAKRLGGFWAIIFMLGYMFYPANVAMFFFEFNFENLALPLIFLLFYFYEKKNFFCFMGICLGMTLVKENMTLVVFMFGLYALLTRKEDRGRWVLYPLMLGAVMFVTEVFIIIPAFRHGYETSNAHWGLYSKLGATPPEIIRTIIFHGSKVATLLVNNHNITFLSKLFGPLLIAALLAPQILLIAAPLFLLDLLSNFSGQQSIDFFYSSALAAFVFMAAVDFLGRLNFSFKNYLLSLMIVLLAVFNVNSLPQWQARVVPFKERQAAAQFILSQIPPDAKVLSSYKFLYLLSQRRDLYVLFLKHKIFSREKEKVPDTVDYMMIDFASRVDNKDSVKKLLSQGNWKVQAAVDEVVLLRKNVSKGPVLIKAGRQTFLGDQRQKQNLILDKKLRMEGVAVPSSMKCGERIMRVSYYWEALKNDKNINVSHLSLDIYQGVDKVYNKDRVAFYGLPFVKGEFYREDFYYFIPRLNPGEYTVKISSHTGVYTTTIEILP